LPRHRGASAINWAVIMGDSKTGVSIFWPDGGIDTGLILLQKEIAIGPDDTTGSLYFNHLFPTGVDAILESIDLIKEEMHPKFFRTKPAPPMNPLAMTKWRVSIGTHRQMSFTTWFAAVILNPVLLHY
jgi:methionyl-tRNA formyltransferase